MNLKANAIADSHLIGHPDPRKHTKLLCIDPGRAAQSDENMLTGAFLASRRLGRLLGDGQAQKGWRVLFSDETVPNRAPEPLQRASCMSPSAGVLVGLVATSSMTRYT